MMPGSAISSQKPKESLLVTALSVIGWVLVGISVLVLLFAIAAESMESAAGAISGIVGGILFVCLAEIIRALQSIEQRLR